MHISKSIIINIEEDVVKRFLRENYISKFDKAQDVAHLLSELIDSREIKESVVKDFFYKELMLGKRNHIRVYNLNDCRNMLYSDDWLNVLKKDYEIESLEFNSIISSIPTHDEPNKIVAIHTEYNEKMEIEKISIIFAYHIIVKGIGDSCSYIPVQFDLDKKLMTIKSWQRQGIEESEIYKPIKLMDKTVSYLEKRLKYSTSNRSLVDKYKETLYNMNKGLVEEMFNNIPSYKDVEGMKDDISDFADTILSKMPLQNKRRNLNGKFFYPRGTIDIKDELLKLIQRLSVADYFMNRDYDEAWKMKTSAIVNSVKFFASDNVVALVSGENKRSPVFCSNSFLSLLKSMEQTEMVDKIWISYKYQGRFIRVNYNASNLDYFEITKLNSRIYSQEELDNIWEVLTNYESTINVQADTVDSVSVG